MHLEAGSYVEGAVTSTRAENLDLDQTLCRLSHAIVRLALHVLVDERLQCFRPVAFLAPSFSGLLRLPSRLRSNTCFVSYA